MKELKSIIKQICAEKGISEESVYETINSALAAAYRKDFGEKNQNVVAEFDPDTGNIRVFDEKIVVENLSEEELAAIEALRVEREARREAIERGESVPEKTDADREAEEALRKFNPKTEIELKEAQAIKDTYELNDIVRTELQIPGAFGRMAAQTAKQVIIQRLREAERNVIYQNYKEREGELLTGTVQKREGRNILVDLDTNVTAILPPQEQLRFERYRTGDRLKVLLLSVALTTRGPELIVSRAHGDFVKELFGAEIPEVAHGTISIKGIAREAGSRSKVAVFTEDQTIDPIGSCIGQRGARIQTIINEIGGEKIDIIEYNEDPQKYITNALLPAKISSVTLNEADRAAVVTVPADQLSLTIGREGQNVRLAVKLTGWKINIREKESGKEIGDAGVVTPSEGALPGQPSVVKPVAPVVAEEAPAEPASEEPVAEAAAEEKPKKKKAKAKK